MKNKFFENNILNSSVKKFLIILNIVVLFGAFGFSVYRQEQYLKAPGFYLKLIPIDPRSIMQGDYMLLNYEVSNKALENILKNDNIKKGYINIKLDKNNVGQYVSVSSKPKSDKEIISAFFTWGGTGVDMGINSYLFQEGDDKIFANAEYAHVIPAKNRLILKELVDKDFKALH